jgi:hypothetical protein
MFYMKERNLTQDRMKPQGISDGLAADEFAV